MKNIFIVIMISLFPLILPYAGFANNAESGDVVSSLLSSNGVNINMSIEHLIADRTCTSYEIPWATYSLSSYVPKGTILVYLQLDGGFTKAEVYDAVTIEVRKKGEPLTNRSLLIDGCGTNTEWNSDGRDYVWVPVDPINPEIEFRIWDIDTPGAWARGFLYLRGYISR